MAGIDVSEEKNVMYETMDAAFRPEQFNRRRELHEKYGGQRQGGISTPARAPFVLLITGDSGKQHGYSDEWSDDGLFYTGEGQHGDMPHEWENFSSYLEHTNEVDGDDLLPFASVEFMERPTGAEIYRIVYQDIDSR